MTTRRSSATLVNLADAVLPASPVTSRLLVAREEEAMTTPGQAREAWNGVAAGYDEFVTQGRVMDALELQLSDGSFDVSASQLGVTVVPDLKRGLGEMVRVTKPGGKVLIAALGPPQKAEFFGFFLAALTATVPGFTGPPTDPPAPQFQVADPARFRQRLAEAGLGDITVEPVTFGLDVPSPAHLWGLLMNSNPMGRMLVADLTGDQRTEFRECWRACSASAPAATQEPSSPWTSTSGSRRSDRTATSSRPTCPKATIFAGTVHGTDRRLQAPRQSRGRHQTAEHACRWNLAPGLDQRGRVHRATTPGHRTNGNESRLCRGPGGGSWRFHDAWEHVYQASTSNKDPDGNRTVNNCCATP